MKRPLLTFCAGLVAGFILAVAAQYAFVAFIMRGVDRQVALRVRTEADLTAYAQSCWSYRQALGTWPETLEGLRGQNPRGTIFIAVPEREFARDAWGHLFTFEPFEPTRGDLALRSQGAGMEVRLSDRGLLRPWSNR